MSSGYGVFTQMLYYWNIPSYYPFIFLLGILLAMFLQLIGVPLRLFALIGSIFLAAVFIPLVLSYFGIVIPTWTAYIETMIGFSTSGLMFDTVPIHIAVLDPELGLGSFLIAGGSVFGIIGSLIPVHKKKKDEFEM